MSEAATLGSSRSARSPAIAWLARNAPLVCLGAAMAVSAVLLIALGSHLTLYADEWNMVLWRRGTSAAAFLDPYNQHLVVGVVLVYKGLLATFGMDSPVPFHVISTLFYLLAAGLLFAYVRRRVGDWLALLGTGLILFLGSAAEDLLFPFQIFFSGSIAAGLGALLALDRDDRRWDLLACALIVVSMSFSEVGIAFSVGALVRVMLGSRPWPSRLYLPLAPLVLYGLWWLVWGHTGHSHVSLHNAAATPLYVIDAVGGGLGALTGLASASDQPGGAAGQQWVPVLLAAAVVLAAWRLIRMGRVPVGVWPVLAIGLVFWVLAGLSYMPGREAATNRYLYPSGVFVLLIAAELLRGVRPGGRALVAAACATAFAIGANLVFLSDSYKDLWKPRSQLIRADLTALEVGGPLNPSFVLTGEVSRAPYFDIGTRDYLSAVQAWGSPAYTQSELASAPEAARAEADKVLGAMLGLTLRHGGPVQGVCRNVNAAPTAWKEVPLAPGAVSVQPHGTTAAKVALGRFADELPVDAGRVAPGSAATLSIPRDAAPPPWRIGVQGEGRVTLCGPALAQASAA